MKHYRLFFVLYICLCLVPLAIFRDYTPSNELRYLSIADEALQNGNVFTFTNHGVAYADKPPLYLWIVMGGKLLFGEHVMWFLTLFSLIPALLIIYVMDKWVRMATQEPLTRTESSTSESISIASQSVDSRRTAAWILISSGLFLGLAVVLRMDMLMNLFITLSLFEFYKMYTNRGTKASAVLFPVYVFMALFSKGPLGFLIPLLCTMVFLLTQRQMRRIGQFWGWKTWAILVAGCAVWFGCAYLEGGKEYLNNLLFHQTVDRAVNAFHHKEPFYYYGITFWYSLAPWSLLIGGVLLVGLLRKRYTTMLEKFFGVVVATTFIMVSCFSSKLAIYLSPAFPFFVYLAILQWPSWNKTKWAKVLLAVPMAVLACALPAVFVLARIESTAYLALPLFYAAGALMSAGALTSLYFLFFGKDKTGLSIRIMSMAFYAALFVGGWSVPQINNRLGYKEVCKTAQELARQNNCTYYATYFVSRSENMDVYLGVTPEKLTEDLAAYAEPTAPSILPTKGSVLITRMNRLKDNPQLMDLTKERPTATCGEYVVFAL